MSELIQKFRNAAENLESIKSNEDLMAEAEKVGGLMSCCGTCTLVSFVPPCKNACIKVSPLF